MAKGVRYEENFRPSACPWARLIGVKHLGAEHSRVRHDRQGHRYGPASAYDFHTWEIFQNVSSGLLAYTPGTTQLVPALATGYTVNAAGDEYTFKLRKGVKFSNGTPFTAAAVKWSIDRVAKLNGDPAALVTQYVKSVDVVDDYTVKFVLNGPVSYLPGPRRHSHLLPHGPQRVSR